MTFRDLRDLRDLQEVTWGCQKEEPPHRPADTYADMRNDAFTGV